jgi:hypothetical protein
MSCGKIDDLMTVQVGTTIGDVLVQVLSGFVVLHTSLFVRRMGRLSTLINAISIVISDDKR